ncbi:MAG: helix-turn-helix domain-containing protein [Magnetospirillum sp.]|nr:helix-turn-helix domain-containing protein [Magnetospirillum sp.]
MAGLSKADLDLVGQAPLFAGIARADLEALMQGAQAVAYAETELLFNEGDTADRFFVIVAGSVNLFALTEAGDQTIIEVFDAVNSFAEAAIFSSGRFPLNCEVTAGSRLVHVPASPFLKRLSENRRVAMQLLGGLALWQARLIREIAALKGNSPVQRLASFLIALAPAAEGSAHLQLPLSKSALASRIGIAPESLSRALARLKAAGVESRGRKVVITDIEALRRLMREADA